MLRTAASVTMALDAVGDPRRVESSAAGPATLCAESTCGCKMPTAPHDDLVAPPDFRELHTKRKSNSREFDAGEVPRISLLGTSVHKREEGPRLSLHGGVWCSL